ncbi:DUF262 domain-containing protein [Vibrio parahaemolyticus]|nr:DUF262 domain-containing protein [Vibrio parahaemolyticus]HCG8844161.1 DUF262 domain-containing protein [Vibrio parahaemolyticus]HDY7694974.1 DUF262 domain-containing protein [Vibrio vulnificus]
MSNLMELETVSLYKLFLQMQDGLIQVPIFQRQYAWQERHILDLFVSISEGFPIGVIILANDNNNYPLKNINESFFPKPNKTKSNYYRHYLVIDGVQRLSTLYNCFNGKNEKFNVWYDLMADRFSMGRQPSDTSVLLSSLFDQKEYFNTIQRIGSVNSDLLHVLDNFYYKIKDFTLPIYKINDIDNAKLSSLFEVINVSGARLTKEDLELAKKYSK